MNRDSWRGSLMENKTLYRTLAPQEEEEEFTGCAQEEFLQKDKIMLFIYKASDIFVNIASVYS